MRADIPQAGDPADRASDIGVLLNADLGEGSEHDREIMPLIDIANIACAAHAGSVRLMQHTVELAIKCQVQISAHPGYPDRENFGRLSMPFSSEAFAAMLVPQLQRMRSALAAHQQPLRFIKPHGALYHDCASDAALSAQFVRLCIQVAGEVTIIGLAGSQLIAQARAAGLRAYAEGFSDRRYLGNGQLAPRHMAGACIDDIETAAQQAMQLVEQQRVSTIDGAIITMPIDTLCVHGDSSTALALAARLSQQLNKWRSHARN